MPTSPQPPPRVLLDISWRTLGRVVTALAAVVLFLRLWPILIVVIVSLILVGTLSPLVADLERRGIRRSWALTIIFVSLFAVAALLALLTAPAIGHQLMQIIERAPETQARLAGYLERGRITAPLATTVRHFRIDSLMSGTLAFSSSIVEITGYVATTIVLAVYILFGRDEARGALYAWIPRRYHLRVARIVLNLETIVGGYMRGQLITSALIAVFVFALLEACKVPNALALSVFAGFTDVIPFVGGLLATAPAVLASLSRGLPTAGLVLLAMMFYQQVESRIIVPRVYGKALRLTPTAVVLALVIGGKLLGIIGALLALPLAAAIRMIFEELRVELPGDDSDDSALRERDARAEAEYAARSAGSAPEEAAAVAAEVADEIRKSDSPDPAVAAETPITGGAKK